MFTTCRIILHFAASHVVTCNTMEQGLHWEATRSSANPEIPCILRNPKFIHRVNNMPTFFPILNKTNTIQTFHPAS